MPVRRAEVTIQSERRVQVMNLTTEVARACRGLGLAQGILLVSVRHTTCALCVNEDEPGLRVDLERLGETLLDPFRGEGGYRHDRIDDNAQAHLTSVLLSHSLNLPVAAGEPVLGTWQSVLLLEMDGPRSRTLDITLVGE